MQDGELVPDFGPRRPHPTAGGTLVAARPPLVAFNVEIDSADVDVARAIAADIRESDGGLPGVRAIGLDVGDAGTCQVSMNVQDPFRVPLAKVVAAVRSRAAERGTAVRCAQLVGLAPADALAGFPEDVEIRGFDERRHVLEHAIGRHVPAH
jgi:glutamate formiminotransferase